MTRILVEKNYLLWLSLKLKVSFCETMGSRVPLNSLATRWLHRCGEERAHRVSRRGRPRTSYVDDKVTELLEAIAEGMPTRGAAAIAQIPFETVRNWMSKNDPAFRLDFLRAFERARAIAVQRNIRKLNASEDWRASALWLERNVKEYAPKAAPAEIDPAGNRQIIIDEDFLNELSAAYDENMANVKRSEESADANT
jgi:hypothetical protein